MMFSVLEDTITSSNIPLLTGALKALGIIGTFLIVRLSCKQQPVPGEFRRESLLCSKRGHKIPGGNSFYGYLLYKVEDPKLFVVKFFGNRCASTSSDVENYIRGFINERIISEFGRYDIFEIVKNADATTDKVTLKISDEVARIGLKVIDCVFEGINNPEEARRFAYGLGAKPALKSRVQTVVQRIRRA